MSLIVAQGLCKSYRDVEILRNVTFTLSSADRVGLIGPNGHGKTTLLRILAGLEDLNGGDLQKQSDLKIGYLPQDPPAQEEVTLRQAMLNVFVELRQTENELHELAHQMGKDCHDPKLLARYGELQHVFESRGGYSYSHKIEQVLLGLKFPREQWDLPLARLSGGQRTRACLAALLLREPDVLLLDEPTNHLDLHAVEWLEDYLESFAGILVVVSHDRYFLDRVTKTTWEVAFTALESYKGAYSRYVTQRQERFLERSRRYEAQQQYIAETEDFIRRFLAGQRSKEAQGRRTRLERFLKTEAIPQPRQLQKISVRFGAVQRCGDFVMHLDHLQVGYQAGQPLVTVEKLDLQRGQRIAIVGPNGCGKTTLLRTMLGSLAPLCGQVRKGANVDFGYLSQTHSELDPDDTAIESVRAVDRSFTEERVRNLLGNLLLSGDDGYKKIRELSGGQRSRVVLARLMLQRPNVLFLDEPTNHLDILSQEVLQDVLHDFEGTVIFVSHDRYLIQALATHLWAVHDGEITPLSGNWERYLVWRQERLQAAGEALPQNKEEAQAKVRRVEDYKERRKRTNEIQRLQRRLAELEESIHQHEHRLKAINEEMNQASAGGDVEQVTKLSQEYSFTDDKIQSLFGEWEQIGLALEGQGAE